MRPSVFISVLFCFVFFQTAISATLSHPSVPDTPGSLYTSPFTIPPTPVASSALPLDCHIAILGAGFSGAYAAYQLSTQYKDRICVVEKQNRYGGRIHDITERADGSGPAYGIGPLGLEANQLNMLHLARELGMEVQADDDNGATLLQVRGRYFLANANRSNSGRMCSEVFPTLNCTGWNHIDTDKGMWKAMLDLFVEQPDIVNKYADFGTFVRAIVGTEGFELLRASSVWESEFEPGVSAKSMLDFSLHLDNPEETSFLRPYRYLKGGMSQYPYRMMANAVSKGVRVFAGEAVLGIDSGVDKRFVIKTEKRMIVADRIINAIDAFAFGKIAGNVARDIQKTKQFQDLKYTACVTVDAWWDDRFWERSKLPQGNTLLQISNHDECFNLMIIPNYPYVKGSNVTRAAYDDGVCVETWRDLLNSGNASLLKEELRAGMQRVLTDVVMPLPRTVKGFVHEQAWYNLGAMSPFNNEDIRKWAIRPVSLWDVSMVGEAYNPAYSSWTEGAIRSTMWTLREKYGFSFPCLEYLDLSALSCASQGNHF